MADTRKIFTDSGIQKLKALGSQLKILQSEEELKKFKPIAPIVQTNPLIQLIKVFLLHLFPHRVRRLAIKMLLKKINS